MEQSAEFPEEGRAARRKFYEAFYHATGSNILVEMIMKLRKMVETHHVIKHIPSDSHGDLKELISTGDARGAARWMTGHLQIALQSQIKTLAE